MTREAADPGDLVIGAKRTGARTRIGPPHATDDHGSAGCRSAKPPVGIMRRHEGAEAGTGGWSLSGASVVSGNESYKVRNAKDSKSLAIAATGRVVSPAFCFSTAHPTFRLFAKGTSGTWGSMNVALRFKDSTGATNETVVGAIGTGTSWSPTQSFALSGPIGLWNADQTASVQIVLDPENYGGAWAIDDVYIDPYKR